MLLSLTFGFSFSLIYIIISMHFLKYNSFFDLCTFIMKINDNIRHRPWSFIPVYSFKSWNMKVMHSKILQEIWSVYLIHFFLMINWCQKSIKKKIVFTDIFNLFLSLFYKLYTIDFIFVLIMWSFYKFVIIDIILEEIQRKRIKIM